MDDLISIVYTYVATQNVKLPLINKLFTYMSFILEVMGFNYAKDLYKDNEEFIASVNKLADLRDFVRE